MQTTPGAAVFRPGFGRVLTVVVVVVCAIALVAVAIQGIGAALRTLPWLLLFAGTCWALFWRPEVVVQDSGVRLVNPLRTVDLAWPAILAVDTKWALTLITSYGRFTAWAAPAPGIRQTLRGSPTETKHLPKSTVGPGGIRPGDLPSTSSGSAALIIRRRWEELRDAGYLEDPRLEHDAPPVHWQVPLIVIGAVLLVLSVLGAVA
jgi:Bacterial PH domain